MQRLYVIDVKYIQSHNRGLVHKRVLRVAHNDYDSSFEGLLDKNADFLFQNAGVFLLFIGSFINIRKLYTEISLKIFLTYP